MLDRIVKKASTKKAEQIGRVDLAGHSFIIAADGNLVLGLVNGYRVIDANLYENPIPLIIPVMANIIAKIFRDSWYEGLTIPFVPAEWDSAGKYPSEEFEENLKQELESILGKGSIVKQEADRKEFPDIGPQQGAIMVDDLIKNLNKYQQQIMTLTPIAENLLEKATATLRIKLVDSMWGVGNIQKQLGLVRDENTLLDTLLFSLGRNCSVSNKAITRLVYRLQNNLFTKDPNEKRVIATLLIPDILTAFDEIKKNSVLLIKTLSPIYKLDKMFKQQTGNPVFLSIPGNLIQDFKESFDKLLDFVVDIPVIELELMNSLERVECVFSSQLNKETSEK